MRARAFGKWIAKTKPLRFPHKKKIIPEEMTFFELREAALSFAPLSVAAAGIAEGYESCSEEEHDEPRSIADGLRSDRTNRVIFIRRIKRR